MARWGVTHRRVLRGFRPSDRLTPPLRPLPREMLLSEYIPCLSLSVSVQGLLWGIDTFYFYGMLYKRITCCSKKQDVRGYCIDGFPSDNVPSEMVMNAKLLKVWLLRGYYA